MNIRPFQSNGAIAVFVLGLMFVAGSCATIGGTGRYDCLHDALTAGDAAAVEALLANGANPDEPGETGENSHKGTWPWWFCWRRKAHGG